jgi:prepilin-type N-terminal cleavage/methylation domain-containing protein
MDRDGRRFMKSIHRSGRAGVTLIELLIVMAIVGILAGIALPSLRSAIDRADAAKVASDMTVVRTAVFEFREDDNSLPRSAGWGRVPPDLASRLDIPFTYKDVEYRLVTNARRGRVEFRVRYARGSALGAALQTFMAPGTESGSVTWTARQTRWRLLEGNQ